MNQAQPLPPQPPTIEFACERNDFPLTYNPSTSFRSYLFPSARRKQMSDDLDQERRKKSSRYDPRRRKFLKGVGVAGAGAALADYLVIGDADNVAARISAPAEPVSGTVDVVLDLNDQKHKGREMSLNRNDCDSDFEFSNWDVSLTCDPDCFYQPRTESELVDIVRDTYQRGGIVRTFGARHSWSPLVLTSDTLVNLDKLKQLVSIDKGRMRASVQAGIRIKDLIKVLRRNGLGLKNLGSIKEQSIAGAISTGTHGTGLNIGSLSTQIVAMKVINGRGEVVNLS